METFAMYAGLGDLFFFLVLFLQQVAGYSPLQSRLRDPAGDDRDVLLSHRFGALADRYGPRMLMGAAR